jgi:hypothetical protein
MSPRAAAGKSHILLEVGLTMDKQAHLLKRIRIMLGIFLVGLILSGITAFPLKWELGLLARWLGAWHGVPAGLLHWILLVQAGLVDTYGKYPWLAYGTDWLAFGHLMIGIAFIGPLRDPKRNIWIVEFGMISCVLVIPLAMICGPIRGIPFYWRLIDCCFGVFGIIPLWVVRSWILQLDREEAR